MVAPATPAMLHALTPGNPVYAEPEAIKVAPPVRAPHPVSKKKKRKRRGA
jgi:hypothetical protein